VPTFSVNNNPASAPNPQLQPQPPKPKPGGKGFSISNLPDAKPRHLVTPPRAPSAGSGAVASAPGIISQIANTNVYVGSLINAANIEALKAGEFTHVLNLARERDGTVARNPNDLKAAGIQERRIPLRDNSEADEEFKIYLTHALDFVRNARKSGGNILIHCHQGISRSVSVAVADRMYQLAEQFHNAPDRAIGAGAPNFYHQALTEVQEARRRANVEAMPNFGFSLVLEELNQVLRGGNFLP
jgi:predicted protein tyrosine phosphatase